MNYRLSTLLIVVVFLGCKNPRQELVYNDIYYDYKCEKFDSYRNIYNAINDTIDSWISDSLGKVFYFIPEPEYQIDSVIVFSEDSSRLFTTVNKMIVNRLDSKLDYIYEFGGAFIEEEWYYYFKTVTMPVSRTQYKDSIYNPYTFDELSYIAHNRRFGSMLKRAEDGSIVLSKKSFNKKFFDLDSGRSYEKEKAYRDSMLIKGKYHKNIRGKPGKKKIEELESEIQSSVRPPEPLKEVKERSWWDKMFGEPEEVKLFESEAWKNRRKNRPK